MYWLGIVLLAKRPQGLLVSLVSLRSWHGRSRAVSFSKLDRADRRHTARFLCLRVDMGVIDVKNNVVIRASNPGRTLRRQCSGRDLKKDCFEPFQVI